MDNFLLQSQNPNVLLAIFFISIECFRRGICPRVRSEVCGSDGKTYRNECEFSRVKCRTNPDHVIVYPEKCRIFDSDFKASLSDTPTNISKQWPKSSGLLDV